MPATLILTTPTGETKRTIWLRVVISKVQLRAVIAEMVPASGPYELVMIVPSRANDPLRQKAAKSPGIPLKNPTPKIRKAA